MTSPGQVAYKLSYEVSPIILTGGIASGVPGGMLPIISLTESLNFVAGLLSGGDALDLDSFFAHYKPVPGGSLVSNQYGKYPFANQAVAANSGIAQPLRVSLLMVCPVRQPFGYATKLATIMALQSTLSQHCNSGGTFTVATPSFFYTNCLLDELKYVGDTDKQTQTHWQWDFEKPLLTEADAQEAQNSLMSKISGGTQIDGEPSWSGLSPTVGQPPSLAGSSVVPAASGTAGSGAAGASPSQ